MTTAIVHQSALIDSDRVADLPSDQRGRLFSITFRKKSDGTIRRITGRLGVNRHLKNGGEHTGLGRDGILTVYDVHGRSYKSIHFDTMLSVRAGGQSYVVCQTVALAA